MQDTILEEMQVGRTGNEVLAAFDARMVAEGINGKMYSHAIGDHGHAAGPVSKTRWFLPVFPKIQCKFGIYLCIGPA